MNIELTDLPSKGIYYDSDMIITIKENIDAKELFAMHDALFKSPDLRYMHKLEAEIIERFYVFDNQHSADNIRLCDMFYLCLKVIEDKSFYVFYPSLEDMVDKLDVEKKSLKNDMLFYSNKSGIETKSEYIEESKSYKYKNMLLSEPTLGNILNLFEYSHNKRNLYEDGSMIHDHIDLTLVGFVSGKKIIDLDTIEMIADMLKDTMNENERLQMHQYINETFIYLKGFIDDKGLIRSMREICMNLASWPTLTLL